MFEDINHDRRRFLGTAAMTIAAARLDVFGSASAHAGRVDVGTNTSVWTLNQIW
jgi:S-formylglutathione hydrolase FrmB